MLQKVMTFTALMAFAVGTITVNTAAADQSGKAEGRTVTYISKQEITKIDDVPGHVVGVAQFKGLSLYDSGEIAICTGAFTFDLTKGKGMYQAYLLNAFEDGSTKVLRGNGIAKLIEGVRSFTAEYAFVGGTGRFEGVKGTCLVTGRRFADVAGYADFVETYTLPTAR